MPIFLDYMRKYYPKYSFDGDWNDLFIFACRNGNIDMIKYAIKYHDVDPTLYSKCIFEAVDTCDAGVMDFLSSLDFSASYYIFCALKRSILFCSDITVRLLKNDKIVQILYTEKHEILELFLEAIDLHRPNVIRAFLISLAISYPFSIALESPKSSIGPRRIRR